MESTEIKRIVEAALLAAGQPLSPVQLAALFGEDEPIGTESIAQALSELTADCEGRGIELVEVASGFRYQVRQDVHRWVSRLWTERQTKYSRALLETLALIAYRQPITRAEIEQIRGVAVSSNIIRTLEEREWVRVVGHRDVPGKPALFGTTRQFLDYFNLKSLDELPPLAEIRDIEDLEPQLDLPETLAAGVAALLAGDSIGVVTASIEEPPAIDGDADHPDTDDASDRDARAADAADGAEDERTDAPGAASVPATDTPEAPPVDAAAVDFPDPQTTPDRSDPATETSA